MVNFQFKVLFLVLAFSIGFLYYLYNYVFVVESVCFVSSLPLSKVTEGDWLAKDKTKSHPFWKFLARNDELLNDYVDAVFSQAKERFDYDTAMGVYLDSPGEKPKMRAWLVYGLEYWS